MSATAPSARVASAAKKMTEEVNEIILRSGSMQGLLDTARRV
jgi:hypothetical protein